MTPSPKPLFRPPFDYKPAGACRRRIGALIERAVLAGASLADQKVRDIFLPQKKVFGRDGDGRIVEGKWLQFFSRAHVRWFLPAQYGTLSHHRLTIDLRSVHVHPCSSSSSHLQVWQDPLLWWVRGVKTPCGVPRSGFVLAGRAVLSSVNGLPRWWEISTT